MDNLQDKVVCWHTFGKMALFREIRDSSLRELFFVVFVLVIRLNSFFLGGYATSIDDCSYWYLYLWT